MQAVSRFFTSDEVALFEPFGPLCDFNGGGCIFEELALISNWSISTYFIDYSRVLNKLDFLGLLSPTSLNVESDQYWSKNCRQRECPVRPNCRNWQLHPRHASSAHSLWADHGPGNPGPRRLQCERLQFTGHHRHSYRRHSSIAQRYSSSNHRKTFIFEWRDSGAVEFYSPGVCCEARRPHHTRGAPPPWTPAT